MKPIFILLICASVFYASAQKVGINKTNPTEALDVNGNVNISGTLKANGTAGSNGQVLMSTGAGLSWGSSMGYKKCKQFMYTGSTSSWTVPAGVTEVMVELWGGGSGGTGAVGGTSGGYARTVQTVSPGGAIIFTIGSGSSYGSSATNDAEDTKVYFPGFIITAFGGGGVSSTYYGSPYSGNVNTPAAVDNAFFMAGNSGTPNQITFGQSNASTYVQIINYGIGGAPVGMFNPNPAKGDIVRLENGSFIGVIYARSAIVPSSGGPAGQSYGWSGAAGMVLVWFN